MYALSLYLSHSISLYLSFPLARMRELYMLGNELMVPPGLSANGRIIRCLTARCLAIVTSVCVNWFGWQVDGIRFGEI